LPKLAAMYAFAMALTLVFLKISFTEIIEPTVIINKKG
jgi:hypothetical protein